MHVAQMESLARNLIAKANSEGIALCLFGGMAVRILCSEVLAQMPVLRREVADLDFAAYSRDRDSIEDIFVRQGFTPDREFNVLNASNQLMFRGGDGPEFVRADIVLDSLNMCHTIPFSGRLQLGLLTVSPTDLLLTKLQIVRFSEKDALDVTTVVRAFPLLEDSTTWPLARLDIPYVAAMCASDWGLFRTVTGNLDKLVSQGISPLPEDVAADVKERLSTIRSRVSTERKTLGWLFRSLVGERLRWYQVPDEE